MPTSHAACACQFDSGMHAALIYWGQKQPVTCQDNVHIVSTCELLAVDSNNHAVTRSAAPRHLPHVREHCHQLLAIHGEHTLHPYTKSCRAATSCATTWHLERPASAQSLLQLSQSRQQQHLNLHRKHMRQQRGISTLLLHHLQQQGCRLCQSPARQLSLLWTH